MIDATVVKPTGSPLSLADSEWYTPAVGPDVTQVATGGVISESLSVLTGVWSWIDFSQSSSSVLPFVTSVPQEAEAAWSPSEAMALLDRWLSEEGDYDETTWPQVREAVEADRTSTRTLF